MKALKSTREGIELQINPERRHFMKRALAALVPASLVVLSGCVSNGPSSGGFFDVGPRRPNPEYVLRAAREVVKANRGKYQLCGGCDGTGAVKWRSGFIKDCLRCDGKGYVEKG